MAKANDADRSERIRLELEILDSELTNESELVKPLPLADIEPTRPSASGVEEEPTDGDERKPAS